ncbi:hypothetical protein BE221DRAFT_92470 [Ostreococcus tauri]|uniref:J domain-containing protein n=1 Tax=Ostreococcus tauri TaxID=70448 RepID=A0A1Y5ICV9_OSTTA|nr:hypothetical protein BE221DRAFT_92470 [Ostreococcus tauri]
MPVSLRPVAAPRGAKRIVIDADGTPRAVTNAVDVLGYVDRTLPRIIAHVAHVNGALGVTAGAREVFVQDARGRVRMLRPNASATLRRGEVLFLQWSKARGTRHGYVLERDDGVGEVQGAEVIEVVDSESDDGTAVKAEFDAAETRRKARREKEEEESAHREAVQQVSIWSAHADLRLFLHRCGISIEQHGRSTKSVLAKAYRQAMLKFHPDRARQKSTRERALADEVTKWLTHAWQSVPP